MRGAAAVGLQNEMFSLPPCSHHALRAAVRSPMSSLVTGIALSWRAIETKLDALRRPRGRSSHGHTALF